MSECIPYQDESLEDASESTEADSGSAVHDEAEPAELAEAVQQIGKALEGDIEPIRKLVEDAAVFGAGVEAALRSSAEAVSRSALLDR